MTLFCFCLFLGGGGTLCVREADRLFHQPFCVWLLHIIVSHRGQEHFSVFDVSVASFVWLRLEAHFSLRGCSGVNVFLLCRVLTDCLWRKMKEFCESWTVKAVTTLQVVLMFASHMVLNTLVSNVPWAVSGGGGGVPQLQMWIFNLTFF